MNNYEFSSNYDIIKSIGSGSFADVWLGRHKLTGEKVGIKIINKKKLKQSDGCKSISDDSAQEQDESEESQINHKVQHEIDIMQMIKPHPFIIQLYNYIETPNYYHIVMEYGSYGNLAEQLKLYQDRLNSNEIANTKSIIDFSDENEIKKIFTQIVRTVIYFHEKCHVAHRDLKAENIIFDKNMNIKIIDFGLGCKIIQNNNGNESELILEDQSICGPPNYVPPEMILKNTILGVEVDTWMLGILLYYMVYSEFPYRGNEIKNLISQIAYMDYPLPEKRTVIKEYVKTVKSKSKSSLSQSESDDDDENEFNFLKFDMFSSFPKKKKEIHKKSSKHPKKQIFSNEIKFYSSTQDIVPPSPSPSLSNSSLNSKEEKIVKFKEFEVDVSENCRDLITRMLCKDPHSRISLNEVLEHRWISEAKDFVSENKSQKTESDLDSQLETKVEQKNIQRSLRAAKLTTLFAEKSDDELFGTNNLNIESVVESFCKSKGIQFDFKTTENQLKQNVFNENTEILRILFTREEKKQIKMLIDSFIEEQ